MTDCVVEAVRFEVPLACAAAGSNGCRRVLDAQTRLIGTPTAQPIRMRIARGECSQRGGVARHSFRRFDEVVEVALVGPRVFHHPSSAIADLCEMF
jgi:hypothetical protein